MSTPEIVNASLAVITARGGSKGIPRKNLVDLGGRPLVAWAIEAALAAGAFKTVIVSTDDEEIAAAARAAGAEVPGLRPKELATDTTPSLDALQYTIRVAEDIHATLFTHIALIQPTTPFGEPGDLVQAMMHIWSGQYDTAVTVAEVGAAHPFRMWRMIDEKQLVPYVDLGFDDHRPRQQLPPVYKRTGAVYASTRETFMERNRVMGKRIAAVIVPSERAIDINMPVDLDLARLVLQRRSM